MTNAGLVRTVNCPLSLLDPLGAALLARGLSLAPPAHATPDLILLWLDPQAPGAAARISSERGGARGAFPVLGLVGNAETAEAFAAATALDVDFYTAATDPATLAAQCLLTIASTRRFAEASPLTGLPGNNALQREIERRLPSRGDLAVLAFDADHFKAYNDRYGYGRGDRLLRYLAEVIVEALSSQAMPGWYAAHLGGDDFVALVRPREAEGVVREVIARFAAGLATHYDEADLARGGVTVRTRNGEVRQQPLATLTIAAVTNEATDLNHPGQLAAVLAELKAHGKTLPGSNYLPDRRRSHLSWEASPLPDVEQHKR